MPRPISSVRGLDDEAMQAKLRELAALWSPIHPMPLAQVVRECVRRCHESETLKPKKKTLT